ncbi:hypothetical protein EPO15_00570 [bacterium]|nr:MAG: hypothetical protein EPO15_00570 [bacterium]
MSEPAPEKPARLKDIPRWDTEAPCPAVVGDEEMAHLAFYSDDDEDITVVVTFWGCVEHRFGGAGAAGGKAVEVLNSRRLHERRAAAADRSVEEVRALKRLRHFRFTFPDADFECLADGYTVKQMPGHTPLKAASDLAVDMRNV